MTEIGDDLHERILMSYTTPLVTPGQYKHLPVNYPCVSPVCTRIEPPSNAPVRHVHAGSAAFWSFLGRVILSSVYSGKPSTVCDKTEFMLTVLMKGWDQDGGDGGRLYDIRCKVN